MRVGLILGGGGVIGFAWTLGSLHALATKTGWDPRRADHLVGTSVGAFVAALIAGGESPRSAAMDARTAAVYRRDGVPWPAPGSLRLSESAIGAMSTAASIRARTSTWWPSASSTW